MTTLISFLGKSKADPQTGYRTANYRFAPDCLQTVPFFGLGLLAYAKPQRLVVAGTAGSMWDVFFDHQDAGDEATLALIEAVEQEAVNPSILAVQEQRLTQRYGIPVKCLLIPYGRDDVEQAAILTDLAEILQPGEEIILDVTHGFRHLPMLALVAARYLALIKDVKVRELYYGALEMTDRSTAETPVLRLSTMLHMLDWVQALSTHEQSGNYGILAPLLQRDGMDPRRAELLAQGAYFERCSNPVQAKEALTGAHRHVSEHQGPLGNLFRDALSEHIAWFRNGNRADWELALADRYLTRQDYLRAITYLYESYISRAVDRLGGDMNNFDDRKEAFNQSEKNQDVWLLTHLRNAMTHGVRTQNSDAKRLLQDQHALDHKLRQLRRTLFSDFNKSLP